MGCFRPEYWSGLPFPPPGDLSDPGIELKSLAFQAYSLLSEPPGKPYPAGYGSIFPEKSCQLVRSQVNKVNEAKFVAQFVQLLKHWLCDVCSCVVMEKTQALSVDQCQLQALQFSMNLIDLLSILFRCNGFVRIQKAVVGQTGGRHQTVTMTCFWFNFGFGNALELLLGPTTELVVT